MQCRLIRAKQNSGFQSIDNRSKPVAVLPDKQVVDVM